MFLTLLLLPFFSRLVYCDASCQSNGQLSVVSQSVEQKGIQFDKLTVNRSIPVKISFLVTSDSPKIASISWLHNGQPIKVEESDDARQGEVWYKVSRQNSFFSVELHIPMPTARVTGNWTLIAHTEDKMEHKAVCYIESPPIIHARLGAIRTNEGQALAVQCDLESYPPPTEFVWRRVYESEQGSRLVPVVNATFSSKDGVKNAVMEWSDSTHATGTYMCTAKSPRGSDSFLIDVRVKGKSAFIWPAVGIGLEILILLITIIIYERHQAKRRKAEENRGLVKTDK